MFASVRALGRFVTDLFKSRCRLEAENLLLPHQLRKPIEHGVYRLGRPAVWPGCTEAALCQVREDLRANPNYS